MKVGIVGSGMVGATAAYAMVMSGVAGEIVMVDKDKERARAEAADLLHAVPFAHSCNVHAGHYLDLTDAKIVLMAAGVSQKPGESRLDLLERNTNVFHDVIPQIYEQAPEAVILVTTNPVDVMTHVTAQIAADFGVPARRVIGTGTTLDTARFRALLGQFLGIDAKHVHGYVVGEHGDSEVFTWSLTTIGNMPLDKFCAMKGIDIMGEKRHMIEDRVRNAAYHIIEGKGATYYGVGSAIARIVHNLLRDRRSIMTVCTPKDEVAGVKDVTLSLPHLIGGSGVLETFPLPYNDEEQAGLRHSAQTLREAIDELEAG